MSSHVAYITTSSCLRVLQSIWSLPCTQNKEGCLGYRTETGGRQLHSLAKVFFQLCLASISVLRGFTVGTRCIVTLLWRLAQHANILARKETMSQCENGLEGINDLMFIVEHLTGKVNRGSFLSYLLISSMLVAPSSREL